ncbi:unnamed protein product [Brugia timori]|uniref:RWD domain-containing protein n=1 Tax=Brugia timori TaxID=42155 RepID=A0A0R3QZL3_9BILA|nr:unnamed protein product [Brugia timori]
MIEIHFTVVLKTTVNSPNQEYPPRHPETILARISDRFLENVHVKFEQTMREISSSLCFMKL